MDMPQVTQCSVTECAYNQDKACHALAITVGDMVHPHCDTFCPSSARGGEPSITAGVGACKVIGCKYNDHLECHASGIVVGRRNREVDCLTYSPA